MNSKSISILFATGILFSSQVLAADYMEATVYRSSPQGVWIRTSGPS
ncbi:MAG: hypothetical protein U0931_39785 [Vulcanimicrobiota bacterium]